MRRTALLCLLAGTALTLPAQTPEQVEFFEKSVRPVLVEKCGSCHGDKMQMAGLNLTSPTGIFHGESEPALVVKGDPENSRIIQVVRYTDKMKMPPTGKLTDPEIEALETWVKIGAPWPQAEIQAAQNAASQEEQKWESKTRHWAFQPLKHPKPPEVRNDRWVRNAVDAFVLAKLEEKGLKPSPKADKLTLLRRAKYDLHGLPPTPEEIKEFQADQSPDAFAKLIDRLLESPRYGERWGRHWLDVARYADSTGLDEDHRYPYAWRYRDYVIDAFNRDLPYDQFVKEQIAGDLLPAETPGEINTRGIVATGFMAIGPKAVAQQDKAKMLYDVIDEQIDVVSKAFMGVTLACARCHDHKFDPLLTKDYYAMAGIFASAEQFADKEAHVSKLLFQPLVPVEEYEQYRKSQEAIQAKERQAAELEQQAEDSIVLPLREKISDYMLAARRVHAKGETAEKVAQETGLELRVLNKWVEFLKPEVSTPYLGDWYAATDATAPEIAANFQKSFSETAAKWDEKMARWWKSVESSIRSNMTPPAKPKFDANENRFFNDVAIANGPLTLSKEERAKVLPEEVLTEAAALRDEAKKLKESAPPEPPMANAIAKGDLVEQKIFVRGNHMALGDTVAKAFPEVIKVADAPEIPKDSGGRLELAEWLVQPDHPLTSRVMVNRIWGWHFGRAIVGTPSNFGTTGDKPTHPELLDYLASEFVNNGWSIKHMHRLLMNSNTYQMASLLTDPAREHDPSNDLFTRFNRRRLSAEEVRDSLLAMDGKIDFTMGGTLQSGFGTDGENSNDRLSIDPGSTPRRSVYLPLRRSNLATMLTLFDFGDATASLDKRMETNVAPQALFMMNSDFIMQRAKALAELLLGNDQLDDAGRIQELVLRAWGRNARPVEIDDFQSYLAAFLAQGTDRTKEDAWQSLCHIVLASNDYNFVD